MAEQHLLADKTGSAKLLVASALARWTKLSRRLKVLAALTRLELRIDSDDRFDLLVGGRRFGDEFREQAVILIRRKQNEDERAMRSAVMPADTRVPTTLPAAAAVLSGR